MEFMKITLHVNNMRLDGLQENGYIFQRGSPHIPVKCVKNAFYVASE